VRVLDPTPGLTLLGAYHVAVFGLAVPFLSIRSFFLIRKNPATLPDRVRHFRTTAVLLVVFGAFSLLTAWREGIDLFRTGWLAVAKTAPVALALYLGLVLLMRPRWRKAVLARKPVVRLFMPASSRERALWLTVALLAGTSEEITWRGVQTALLGEWTGSLVAAVALSALMFGAAHALQGWTTAAIVTGFALAFQGLVLASGSLLPAMAVHVAYDVTAGLQYGKLGRELGYDTNPQGASPAT
jgi:membrane protease YdiL (CAAX protease family)